MTQTAASPPQTTIISTLPLKDTAQATDRLLCIQQDGTLQQLLGNALASQGPKGDKGDKGDPGPAGIQGPAGKDGRNGQNGANAAAPPLAIFAYYDDTPPEGYLFLQGQAFETNAYPILGAKFSNGKLPDFRNRVPRGAGDLIQLGALQEDSVQQITGIIGISAGVTGATGCLVPGGGYTRPATYDASGNWQANSFNFDASKSARTAEETRVKAIGVNFIIKAA